MLKECGLQNDLEGDSFSRTVCALYFCHSRGLESAGNLRSDLFTGLLNTPFTRIHKPEVRLYAFFVVAGCPAQAACA